MSYASHRYAILFGSLLATLGALPLLRPLGFDGDWIEVFLAVNLLAAVLAVGAGWLRRLALAVLAVALLARIGAASLGLAVLSHGSRGIWSVLAFLAMASALKAALQGGAIDTEKICAALSVYLLAGFFFGLTYAAMDNTTPGALTVGGAVEPTGLSVPTAIYFSFITLASLGYGDVLPVSDAVRGLAAIEVIGGQLYLAVMVARLVGAWR